MRTFGSLAIGTLLAALAGVANAVAEPVESRPDQGSRVVVYAQTSGAVENPGRGFSWPVDLISGDSFAKASERHDVRLVRAIGRLDAYRDRDLPAPLLRTIDERLAEARQAGVKLILRFAYNDGPYPHSAPDASLDWIRRHIEQLKPYLQRHADVIAWMEAGFIGAWGEWHTSTHGLDKDPAAKRSVAAWLLAALPNSRSIQLRTPADLSLLYDDPAAAGERARIGHHNDCFLASSDDSGTYGRGRLSIAQDKALIASIGQFAPVGGETCMRNPPRSACPTALSELAQLGFSELNLAYNREVLADWRTGNCLDEIASRLGYRLSLKSLVMPQFLERGSTAHISIEITNTGFSAPLDRRPVYLLIDGPTRRIVRLRADPRAWMPGKTQLIDAAVPIAADAARGAYALSLWLPDAASTLRDDPRYAVRMANVGTWRADRGVNTLIEGVPLR